MNEGQRTTEGKIEKTARSARQTLLRKAFTRAARSGAVPKKRRWSDIP
ncbi:hypothetical protein [Methylocystis parvus]|nr:hypothetical protein [Methylocystis parvus]WBK02309.1 hypothetical protein MMG94_19835 [Methylocystis parvus OBBP]